MPQESVHKIKIVTAIEITKESIDLFAKKFAEHLNIKEYSTEYSIDKEIIGGIIIFAGGYRYDFSVKRKLDIITEDLKNANASTRLNKETDEIPKIIKDTLCQVLNTKEENYFDDGIVEEVGTVIAVGDSIATVSGLNNCRNGELIRFNSNTFGIAMDLKEKYVSIVLLGDINSVYEGMICTRTKSTISVPVGRNLLGRVVNALGEPIDGLGPIHYKSKRPIESSAPSIVDRKSINKSLHTGILSIDAMVPIGRGQRELIIGDRQTGKTSIAIDTIINQRGKGIFCIYVAIGQKMSTISTVVNTLRLHNAMSYTTVVASSAGESASMQYISPYAGCAMAEELMYNDNADVLIVYDDLTKHAQAYRSISLLLKRPPGREAYPGDVFYLHSRLLERAARLNDENGNGSITALPIVETQVGDISGYIPTNLISITDGQIYLEEKLFLSGQRPAINVGLSVSRVGGSAQTSAMKKVSGSLRINMAQYKELEAFSQFGSDLDESTRSQIVKGHNLLEVLKQDRFSSMNTPEQVLLLYLANNNKFISFYSHDIKPFFKSFVDYLNSVHPEIIENIKQTGEFTDKTRRSVDVSFGEYYQLWKAQTEDYETDI